MHRPTDTIAAPRLSVIIATYNRPELLAELLTQLGAQSTPASTFEVVVVDDGSSPPVGPRLASLRCPYSLTVFEQKNAGAAAARHRAVLAAKGDVLLMLDDDMGVSEGLLAEHLKLHEANERLVILGHIRPDTELAARPLFERYLASRLERMSERFRDGSATPDGTNLYTGNASLRREDYLQVGGLDATLGRSEDVELGVRLQESGVRFRFSHEAFTIHRSDHASLEGWRKSNVNYGTYDLRIARAHPDSPAVNPFRFFRKVNPVSRPLFGLALFDPPLGRKMAAATVAVAQAIDRIGDRRFEKVALSATGVSFGLDYFSGVGDEAGSPAQSIAEILRYVGAANEGDDHLGGHLGGSLGALAAFFRGLSRDHSAIRTTSAKYRGIEMSPDHWPSDLVEKIGFQMMAAYRVMRLLYMTNQVRAAQVVSRLIRHLYGSDIHWAAELAPGVQIIHGMGMAISHGARVGAGSILNHHVTLGEGTHPVTRKVGAPTVGTNVHIGPGATLVGPITIGSHSKIMPGAFVTDSVPEHSLVEVPAATARPRVRKPRA